MKSSRVPTGYQSSSSRPATLKTLYYNKNGNKTNDSAATEHKVQKRVTFKETPSYEDSSTIQNTYDDVSEATSLLSCQRADPIGASTEPPSIKLSKKSENHSSKQGWNNNFSKKCMMNNFS